MWRQKNQDSDQSISDEEDIYDNKLINPRTSIKPTNVKKAVFTNLDSEISLSSETVLESISDEDHISNDEDKLRPNNPFRVTKSDFPELESMKQDETSMWSSVFEETKDLMCLPENYEVKKIGKGSRSKSKPTFSFGFHSDREASLPLVATDKNDKSVEVHQDLEGSRSKSKPTFSFGFHSDREASLPLVATDKNDKSVEVHQDLEGFEEQECENREYSMAELLEGLRNKRHSESLQQVSFELLTGEQRNVEHPIAKVFEGLLENHGPNKYLKGKRLSLAKKRVRSSVAYRASEEGDTSESMDSSTSSDDEAAKFQLQVYDKNPLNSTAPEINGQTMADRFQEALNAAGHDQGMLFITNKQTSIGYYGRLQEVMQIEKERHMEFLNQSQAGIMKDEARFIDAKILSRYLDAKLTVCQCSLGKNIESTQEFVEIEGKRTIIFSTRICNNVDMEVGKFVRIHPPWKEVKVKSKDASIILCTYFSQIPI